MMNKAILTVRRKHKVLYVVAMILTAGVLPSVLLRNNVAQKPKADVPSQQTSDTQHMTKYVPTTDAKFIPPAPGFTTVRKQLSTDELRRLESKSLHELSSIEPYLSRRQGIQERCHQQQQGSRELELSLMIYDDTRKFVMCDVAKGASTTWRKLLWYLIGKVQTKEELATVNEWSLIINRGQMPVLSSLSRDEAMKRLETYTTFMVTRNPMDRLVSAHDSKFTRRYSAQLYSARFGRPIARSQAASHLHGVNVPKNKNLDDFVVENDPTFRQLSEEKQSEVLKYIEIMKTGEITFDQFARYIAEGKWADSEMDVHWRPQTTLCNPCAVNYDYFIKFENLNEDSNRILEYLQRGESADKQIRMDPGRAKFDGGKTLAQLDTVDAGVRQRLRKRYAKDFDIFGYNWGV